MIKNYLKAAEDESNFFEHDDCEISSDKDHNIRTEINIKRIYLDENDTQIYNLTLELKDYYESYGLMTNVLHIDIIKVIEKCMNVSKIEFETYVENNEYNSDYESEDEKNIFI